MVTGSLRFEMRQGTHDCVYPPAPVLPALSLDVGAESVLAETSVGAIRRFFGCWAGAASGPLLSSFSDSLAVLMSRLPRTVPVSVLVPPCELGIGRGVCGGVVRGSDEGCAECAAVTDGTDPRVGVGLFTTAPACWFDDCVATEQAELDRAGLAGGA